MPPFSLDTCAAIERLLDRFADLTGRTVAWLTLLMMFVTCIVVIIRYLLNSGSIGLQESVTYMHGTVFLLGIAYTLRHQGHVRVDIIYQKLTIRSRAIIDLAGTIFLLFPVSIFIGWISIDYVVFSWQLSEGSAEPGGLPAVYLLKTLLPLMAASLAIQGVSEVLRNLRVILGDTRERSAR